MNAYNYHPMTGEYLGASVLRESPLEPGVYLVPAHATTVEPPQTEAGYTRVWSEGDWSQVEDHRGKSGYVDGAETTIAELGPLPQGWSATPPPPTAEQLAATIRAERNAKIAACDWTQMPDGPLSTQAKAAWAAYRQALRDVPEQAGFPQAVDWPKEP
jgi:hypothetical protein